MRQNVRLAVLILVIIVMALPILTYPLARDHGEFATIGREILDNKAPYIDVWNPKPPAVFYLYAAAIALLGQTTAAVRSLDLWLFPLMAWGLYRIGKRLASHTTALMAVAIFGGMYFLQSYWTLTQNDGLANITMIWAVAAAFSAQDKARGFWPALWSGAFSALALWFKYPFLFFIVGLVVGHSISLWQAGGDWRRRLRLQALGFALGGSVVGFGGMAYLASIGAFDAWIESALLTSTYTRNGFNDIFKSVPWRGSLESWLSWPIVSLVVGWPFLRWIRPRRKKGWHIVWLWWLGGLAALISQAKGYDYHYLPMVPPLALLAADNIERIRLQLSQWQPAFAPSLRRVSPLLTISFMLFLVGQKMWLPSLAYITGRQSQLDYYGDFVTMQSPVAPYAVADYLIARNVPRDSLFIWGFQPEIYYLTNLRPATRFIFQFPLISDWYPPEWRQENVDLLWAALPPYVLVVQADYNPWVTGRNDDSKTMMEQDYIELLHWLQYNYVEETKIDTIYVWHRRDLAGETSPP